MREAEACHRIGLIVGNGGRELAMSDATRQYIDLLWELVDEILNAVLFLLIGMEVLVVAFSVGTLVAAAITLAARALTVGLPVSLLLGAFKLPKGSGWVLTWGGLRGGISVALASLLPMGPQRDIVLALTYCVVVFSIVGQRLTLGRVVREAVTFRD